MLPPRDSVQGENPTQLKADIVVVQLLNHVQLFVTSKDCSTAGFPVLHCLQSLFKLMSIESVMLSNRLIFCYPLFLLPSIFPGIRVFSNGLWIGSLHQVTKVLEFQLLIYRNTLDFLCCAC